jgi:hypothetical protein
MKKFKGVSGDWVGYSNHPFDLRNDCPDAVVHIYNNLTGKYLFSYENGHEFSCTEEL